MSRFCCCFSRVTALTSCVADMVCHWPWCHLEQFHINHVASVTRALYCVVILTFDLLILKLMHIIAGGVGKLPTNFGVSGNSCSRPVGRHLSDTPRDIAILTFELGGHGTWWYRSSCSICRSSLKFVGFPVWKIWQTFSDSINRPGNLWPFYL